MRCNPNEIATRHSELIKESVEFMRTLHQCDQVESISEMLAVTSYVFLTRPARVRLMWRILKTMFR